MGLKPGQKLVVFRFENRIEMIPAEPIKKLRGFARGIDTRVPVMRTASVRGRRWPSPRPSCRPSSMAVAQPVAPELSAPVARHWRARCAFSPRLVTKSSSSGSVRAAVIPFAEPGACARAADPRGRRARRRGSPNRARLIARSTRSTRSGVPAVAPRWPSSPSSCTNSRSAAFSTTSASHRRRRRPAYGKPASSPWTTREASRSLAEPQHPAAGLLMCPPPEAAGEELAGGPR